MFPMFRMIRTIGLLLQVLYSEQAHCRSGLIQIILQQLLYYSTLA